MAFVNELIPENERSEIPFDKFKPFRRTNIDEKYLDKWTIDKERGCYFIQVKKFGPEEPRYFGGSWKGQSFKFSAMPTRTSTLEGKYHLLWEIWASDISYPLETCKMNTLSENEAFRAELLTLLAEGLITFGLHYNDATYDQVTVEIGESK
ncbi:MAG: hypothetical protein ACJAZP_001880 [Psychromonas sp.]|jgi:hypothetical protein|uniref:hypothetical protein n=1 Tax=Psychromonas sp. TaxID=1884585 RepID=UPI0039E535A4